MQYKIERDEKQAKISVSLTSEEWNESLNLVYQRTKHKYNIPGFRKGKAPRKTIENFYGPSVFFEDAFNQSFSKAYTEILEKEKSLEPIDRPSVTIDDMTDDGAIAFTATVLLKPQVKLKAYKGLTYEVPKAEVTDHEVEHEIYHARERAARKIEVTDRSVKEGDIANINFSGSVDGKKFDGGTAENYDLEIGSGSFIDNFEEQIIGMNIGETKDVNVKFPDDYHAKHLAGKPAVFAVKLNKIYVKEIPEANDDFAKDSTEFETFKEYEDSVRQKLLSTKQRNSQIEGDNKLVEMIVEGMEADIPPVMIEHQIDAFLEDMSMRLNYQGMRLEDYFGYMGTTVEKYREEHKADAEKTVKTRLALEAIIEKENLAATKEEIDQKLAERANAVGKSVEEYTKNINERQLGYLADEITMSKLMDFLRANNTAKEVAAAHEESCAHCK